MATLIPNSFQHPNILIDKLDYFLTPEESKVLSKAVREILGWEDKIEERKAPISLTVFVEGKFKKDKRLAYGCGLGLQAVRNALNSLHKFGILIKVGQPTQDGQWYWLQDDESKINWKGLEARRAGWDAANTRRTRKATKKSLQSRGVTSDVRGNVGRKGGVTSDVRDEVTSDVNKETQSETQLETQEGGATLPPAPAKPETPPAVKVFRSAAHRYPPKSWYGNIDKAVGRDPPDLEFWHDVVKTYVGLGWNPTNVVNMLEFFEKREIPSQGSKNGGKLNGPNQRPDRRRDPDETFLDPISGQLVRKDPGTGELVPVP
jgi:hypothetical protein